MSTPDKTAAVAFLFFGALSLLIWSIAKPRMGPRIHESPFARFNYLGILLILLSIATVLRPGMGVGSAYSFKTMVSSRPFTLLAATAWLMLDLLLIFFAEPVVQKLGVPVARQEFNVNLLRLSGIFMLIGPLVLVYRVFHA